MKTLSLLAAAALCLSSCASQDIAQAREGLALAGRVLDVLAAQPVTSAKAVTDPRPN